MYFCADLLSLSHFYGTFKVVNPPAPKLNKQEQSQTEGAKEANFYFPRISTGESL